MVIKGSCLRGDNCKLACTYLSVWSPEYISVLKLRKSRIFFQPKLYMNCKKKYEYIKKRKKVNVVPKTSDVVKYIHVKQ